MKVPRGKARVGGTKVDDKVINILMKSFISII
jgi:hypothetical protein